MSQAERVTVDVTDPCEPDLGNTSEGKWRPNIPIKCERLP